MATTMSATVSVALRAVETRDNFGLTNSTTEDSLNYSVSSSGSDLGDHVYHDQYSIANAAEALVDLAGTLTDKWGNTLTFTRVNAILIKTDKELTIGGGTGGAGAADAFVSLFATDSDLLTLAPNGTFLIIAPGSDGYAPTAGSDDVLCISNDSGETATVDLIIMGEADEA